MYTIKDFRGWKVSVIFIYCEIRSREHIAQYIYCKSCHKISQNSHLKSDCVYFTTYSICTLSYRIDLDIWCCYFNWSYVSKDWCLAMKTLFLQVLALEYVLMVTDSLDAMRMLIVTMQLWRLNAATSAPQDRKWLRGPTSIRSPVRPPISRLIVAAVTHNLRRVIISDVS